jgi:hypothetical protein
MVVQSSQVQGLPSQPSRPRTPLRPISAINALYTTPQRAQDLYRTQRQLQKSENVTHSTRLVFYKAGKAISAANTRAALLEAENIRLKRQVETLTSTKPRKRIQIDPQERFANIEAIKKALDESAAEQARRSIMSTEDTAAEAAAAAAAATLESMCTQWQL